MDARGRKQLDELADKIEVCGKLTLDHIRLLSELFDGLAWRNAKRMIREYNEGQPNGKRVRIPTRNPVPSSFPLYEKSFLQNQKKT